MELVNQPVFVLCPCRLLNVGVQVIVPSVRKIPKIGHARNKGFPHQSWGKEQQLLVDIKAGRKIRRTFLNPDPNILESWRLFGAKFLNFKVCLV